MTPIRQIEIRAARDRLKLGASLAQAADHVGVEPYELDLALWRHLGRFGGDFTPSQCRNLGWIS